MNIGNQLILWRYKTPLRGEDLSQIMQNINYPGVYGSGLVASKFSDNSISVTPGTILISDGTHLVKVVFQDTFKIPVIYPFSFVVLRYLFENADGNYVQLVNTSTPLENDVVLCLLEWIDSGGGVFILNSVDNSSKTYGINTYIEGIVESLKPTTDITADRTVIVASGRFVYGTGSVDFTEDSIQLDVTGTERVDVIGVNALGVLVVTKGVDGFTTPPAYGNYLPVAEVLVTVDTTIILQTNIKDVRPFLTYFGVVNASEVVVDSSSFQVIPGTVLSDQLGWDWLDENLNKAEILGTTSQSVDYDTLKFPGIHENSNATHSPDGTTTLFRIQVSSSIDQTSVTQVATRLSDNSMYVRTLASAVWGSWETVYSPSRGFTDKTSKNINMTGLNWATKLATLYSGMYYFSGTGQINSPDGTTDKVWFIIVNAKGGDLTNASYSAVRQDTNEKWFNCLTSSVLGEWETFSYGFIPFADDSSIDTTLAAWNKLKPTLKTSYRAKSTFSSSNLLSTFSVLVSNLGGSGVLSSSGEVVCISSVGVNGFGQKISSAGVVSTFSVLYGYYNGGVLAPNGDIHFVPALGIGQKVSPSFIASTYSLIYTGNGIYRGGVLSPSGEVHFIPNGALVGQKVNPVSGVVSTYSIITNGYAGGVLAPNGDIHFIPYSASVGQKLSAAGVVSTYAILTNGYYGGVLNHNGEIIMTPINAAVGQKVSLAGVVSTYSLVYTVGNAYSGGVLSPNGDVHFVPFSGALVGQKVSLAGVVSTYTIISNGYIGGVLTPQGDIIMIPTSPSYFQKITTLAGVPLSKALCCHPFFNKF